MKHSGPSKPVLYFTGATNILYTFGGHAVTVYVLVLFFFYPFNPIHPRAIGVYPELQIDENDHSLSLFTMLCCLGREIMHAMWKPQKFKSIYLFATLYVLTLTLPSASAVYWAFGDLLLNHSNAFALLPKNLYRDFAVVLMLIHQFITFGFACTPLYFVWEKLIGMHECRSMCKRAAARLPVVVPIWFLAIIFPFFGPINSTVGSLLVSFTVYIIPALAHIFTFRSSAARENAVEQPPRFLGRWTGAFTINAFIVVWVFIVGFGFGGWASMINFVHQIDTFGLFTKCYQCPPPVMASPPPISHPHVNHTHGL